MRVCLLTDKPDHPLLAGVADLLGSRHSVEVLDPDKQRTCMATALNQTALADLYLLKSRSPRAVALARYFNDLGGRVVNDVAATEAAQDRYLMASRAREAGLLFPDTYYFTRLSGLIAYFGASNSLRFPLVVKSRRSRRNDLVTRVGSSAELRAVSLDWAWEPVVVQPFVPNDGWDHKFWVIGTEVFTATRRTVLDGTAAATTLSRPCGQVSADCAELLLRVGKIFGLEVYGVDVLMTARGPVIVDVNAFPGCRGVPGAPEALATLVRDRLPGTTAPGEREAVPLAALHRTVRDVVTTLGQGSGKGVRSTGGMPHGVPRTASVRRKPGRGLVASYWLTPADGRRSAKSWQQRVTVRLAERMLTSPRLTQELSSVKAADFHGNWPGVLSCPRIGMTMQCFPADDDLPRLAAALTPEPKSRLGGELAQACRLVTGDANVRLLSVEAVPVRYKPHARCVIRYHVRVEVPGAAPGERELVFFGKVHSDLSEAAVAHHVAEDLWHARAPLPGAVRRFIPRPLALVQELNLVLSEAAGGAEHREWISGTAVLRPPGRRGTAGGAAHCANAHTALVASATALASWHTSEVSGWLAQQRCAERYAAKVMHWTRVLIGQTPALGSELASAASYLAQTLSAVSVECAVPVHGAFKPSQLVFNGAGQPVVTDFDGACLGDPALDVGCFLAYLRPAGLRSGKRLSVTPAGLPRDEGDSSSGSVQWLASARLTFLDAYFRTLSGYGASASRVRAIGQRADLFEAALMFKIASRRARRLNSPQLTELKAVLSEIEECLLRFDVAKEALQ